MSRDDVLRADWRRRRVVREVEAERDLVVEDAESGFCGAVIGFESGAVVLEDRFGKCRAFPLLPAAFLLEGELVTLSVAAGSPLRRASRPGGDQRGSAGRSGFTPGSGAGTGRRLTASGSVAVPQARARVATASRIWVEGLHDATIVERIWGDDLRVEGVVVEPLDGVEALPAAVRSFRPGPGRRLGVLVDHLVPGSKESRVVAGVISPYVLVTGHPYVDIWQAVRPARLGLDRWPEIPPGRPWKEGVCAALGVADPGQMWRRILATVRDYHDVETPLITSMERLIDFVTAEAMDRG